MKRMKVDIKKTAVPKNYHKYKTYLNTWFVQTITGCWLESWLSLTCRTTCTQIKSPSLRCICTNNMQERSCSDCVTVKMKTKINYSNISNTQILINYKFNYKIIWL